MSNFEIKVFRLECSNGESESLFLVRGSKDSVIATMKNVIKSVIERESNKVTIDGTRKADIVDGINMIVPRISNALLIQNDGPIQDVLVSTGATMTLSVMGTEDLL
jgi:hypothetical protein